MELEKNLVALRRLSILRDRIHDYVQHVLNTASDPDGMIDENEGRISIELPGVSGAKTYGVTLYSRVILPRVHVETWFRETLMEAVLAAEHDIYPQIAQFVRER